MGVVNLLTLIGLYFHDLVQLHLNLGDYIFICFHVYVSLSTLNNSISCLDDG